MSANPSNWPKGMRRISKFYFVPDPDRGLVQIGVTRVNRQTGLLESSMELGAMALDDFKGEIRRAQEMLREMDGGLTLCERFAPK